MESVIPKKRSRKLQNIIRPDLLKENINLIKSSNIKSVKLNELNIEIISDPFFVVVIDNFIYDTELLKSVLIELNSVEFLEKNNDLYQFRQSNDVRNLKDFISIQCLYSSIQNEVLEWICRSFGNIELNKNVSATFSSYGYRDRLLCHDDRCDDRHIAFILYLTENWNDSDGGILQLYSSNSDGYPDEIKKSITPKFNTLVLFEVTHKSFHQVSEVFTKTKKRISINGWFHSKKKKYQETDCKILTKKFSFGNEKDFNLNNYFSEIYLNDINKIDIKKKFKNNSEILLENFLKANFWDELYKDFQSSHIKWNFIGPPNIRKYEVADTSTFTPSLEKLKNIFESKCWFDYLKSITSLDFIPSHNSNLKIWRNGILPSCTFEIQRWSQSCYTLIHDKDPDFHKEGLDMILRIPFERSSVNEEDILGSGSIIYIDSESKEEECLLHFDYKMNALGLIFRDEKTLRFTKYMHSSSQSFYQIFCTYHQWQPNLNQPNVKHRDSSSESDYSIDSNDSFLNSE